MPFYLSILSGISVSLFLPLTSFVYADDLIPPTSYFGVMQQDMKTELKKEMDNMLAESLADIRDSIQEEMVQQLAEIELPGAHMFAYTSEECAPEMEENIDTGITQAALNMGLMIAGNQPQKNPDTDSQKPIMIASNDTGCLEGEDVIRY